MGTPAEDLLLLQVATEESLASSGLEVKARIVESADLSCTGTSTNVNSGREAVVTITIRPPSGDPVDYLGGYAAALDQVNHDHFGGAGVVRDDSGTPQRTVSLRAEGFIIDLTADTGSEPWSLDASGPCRL